MDKGLYFCSEFCSGCKAVKATIDQLITEGYNIEIIDVKKQKDVAKKYEIKAVPVFIILRDNKEIVRLVGPEKITLDEVKKLFKKSNNPDDYKVW